MILSRDKNVHMNMEISLIKVTAQRLNTQKNTSGNLFVWYICDDINHYIL